MKPLIVTCCLLLAQTASAGIISTGAWVSVHTGSFFWSDPSEDGPDKGIGSLLSNVPNLEYLDGPGPVAWHVSGPVTDVIFLDAYADYRNLNRIGWHEWGGPAFGDLFAGVKTNGAATTSPPVQTFGLWLLSPTGFYVAGAEGAGHFALFRSGATYYVGMEDLKTGAFPQDFNDSIVSFTQAVTPEIVPEPVPEPATIVLLWIGLAIGARRRQW